MPFRGLNIIPASWQTGAASVPVPTGATGGAPNLSSAAPRTRPLSAESVAAVPRSNLIQRQTFVQPLKKQSLT